MKALTPTLEAAQRARHRAAYVEARVTDRYQGARRLVWQNLYTGAEVAGYHGLAFDNLGYMHRVRGQGNYLYRQRVVGPGPGSPFSSWTLVATNLDGPCAIAAYGPRIYIFWVTDDNEIVKYYSHNNGTSWTAGVLSTYTDVRHLAACWWGSTSTVICFALRDNAINAIRLDTDTQGTNEHTHSFTPPSPTVLAQTFGIGATYEDDGPSCQLLLAGRQVDTPYHHLNVYRTWFSGAWIFGPLDSLARTPEGEDVLFSYPEVHLPSSPAAYEPTRALFVEDFAGVAPFSRPLACHLVPGTAWSDSTVTEPAPFLDITTPYGLRMQTTADYWWITTPSLVYRAPRVMPAALVLAGDIASIAVNRPGSLIIELDNSKGQYENPGTAGLAALRLRSEVELYLGYRVRGVPGVQHEEIAVGTWWIDSWHYHHAPNITRFTLTCTDGWGLLQAWTPRYQLRWNDVPGAPYTVAHILARILARVGVHLDPAPPQPRSSAIDNFYPDFTVLPGQKGDTAVRRLLATVPDRLFFTDAGRAQTKDPRPAEAPAYEFSRWAHPVLSGRYGHQSITTRVRALGRDPATDTRILWDEADWDALADGVDDLAQVYDPNLTTALQAEDRALAMARLAELRADPALITVPPNVGQELYDVVTVIDPVCSVDRAYRVLSDRIDYAGLTRVRLFDRHPQYDHTLTLGAP